MSIDTLPDKPSIPRLPMAETFFIGALTSNALAHGYVLKGKATDALYHLALTVAQILNCSQRPNWETLQPNRLSDLACGQCTNCRWIAQNSHPTVLTISRLTYQVNEKGDLISTDDLERQSKKASPPTQIKTAQIGQLIHQLSMSCDSTRVVIFTDVEELPASIPSTVVPPYEWRGLEANEGKSLHIRPLERSIFNESSVNKFLKTLEEPPPGTLFFFITETEEQLLETVVSRCQVIPCLTEAGSSTLQAQIPAEYQDYLDQLIRQSQQGNDVFALAGFFETFFITEQKLTATQALSVLQNCFREKLLREDFQDNRFAAYRQIQHELNQTIRKIEAKTNEGQCLLNLFIALTPYLKAF